MTTTSSTPTMDQPRLRQPRLWRPLADTGETGQTERLAGGSMQAKGDVTSDDSVFGRTCAAKATGLTPSSELSGLWGEGGEDAWRLDVQELMAPPRWRHAPDSANARREKCATGTLASRRTREAGYFSPSSRREGSPSLPSKSRASSSRQIWKRFGVSWRVPLESRPSTTLFVD